MQSGGKIPRDVCARAEKWFAAQEQSQSQIDIGSTNCKIEYYKNIILVEVPVISNIFTKTPYVPNLGNFFSHAPVVADLSGVFPRQMVPALSGTIAFRQNHQPPRRFHGIFKSLFCTQTSSAASPGRPGHVPGIISCIDPRRDARRKPRRVLIRR